jgi:hypothetical protein
MIVIPLIKLPFQVAGLALKALPDPKWIICAASIAVIAVQPINKQVESAYHFGFEKSITTPSVGVGKLRTPEINVKIYHIPAAQQVVEASQKVVAEVVTTVAQSAGLDVDFTIGNPDEVETAIIHGAINLGITDVGQISYILATARHESASYSTIHEIGAGGYCGDSKKYDGWAGVGLVQLTWKGNYEEAKTKLGFDHLTTEDFCRHIATRPDVVITILIQGMMEGWFTGVGLPRYVNESKRDYVNARRVVNGVDRKYHIAAIAKNYESMVEQVLRDYDVK